MNKIGERVGDGQRNETQNVKPADETRDHEQDPVPDIGGGKTGNPSPVHLRRQTWRFDGATLEEEFRGCDEENGETKLKPRIEQKLLGFLDHRKRCRCRRSTGSVRAGSKTRASVLINGFSQADVCLT